VFAVEVVIHMEIVNFEVTGCEREAKKRYEFFLTNL
jgi:hypothetical protein